MQFLKSWMLQVSLSCPLHRGRDTAAPKSRERCRSHPHTKCPRMEGARVTREVLSGKARAGSDHTFNQRLGGKGRPMSADSRFVQNCEFQARQPHSETLHKPSKVTTTQEGPEASQVCRCAHLLPELRGQRTEDRPQQACPGGSLSGTTTDTAGQGTRAHTTLQCQGS